MPSPHQRLNHYNTFYHECQGFFIKILNFFQNYKKDIKNFLLSLFFWLF